MTRTAEAVAEPTPTPTRHPDRGTLIARIRKSVDAQTISLLAALAGLVESDEQIESSASFAALRAGLPVTK